MKNFYNYLKATILFAIALVSINAQAQSNGSISGSIATSDGKVAEAVNVFIKELNRGAITSENGTFVIKNVKPGTYTVKSGGVGLAYQEKSVTVAAGQNSALNFTLNESSEKLTEVVVTGYKSVNQRPVSAGKVAIKPLDNPQMVQVIGSQVIADQQINRLSDVIKNVNGVNLGSSRGGVQETFYARGYSLSSTNLFKNGSRVSSGVIPEASTLESVEILKGSSALLYGNVTSGAVINMVTKQPKSTFGGEVSFRGGSYDFYKPTVDIYGPIVKNLAFRIVGTGEDAGSFRNGVKSDRKYVNPSLSYQFSPKTNLLLQADYLSYSNTPDFGIGSMAVASGKTITKYQIVEGLGRSSFFNTPWAYNNAKQLTSSATFNHELNKNWKMNTIASYQRYDRNAFGAERVQIDEAGYYARSITRNQSYDRFYNSQLNLNGMFKTGRIAHNLLIGTDAEQYQTMTSLFDLASTSYDKINVLNPALSEARTDMPVTNRLTYTLTPVYRFGAYFQDHVSVTEKVKLLAGLRWTYQKAARGKMYDANTSERTTYAVQYNAVANQDNGYNRAFSPKLGVVYQPRKTTSLFASYSNNFIINTGTTVDSVTLNPSSVDQYEAGIKNDLLKGRLSLNISVYRIINDKTYGQADSIVNAKGAVVANANSSIRKLMGESTSDGIELDLNGSPMPGLNIIAGYSYNFIRYTKTSGLKYSPVEGERLVGSVAHTANASAFYTAQRGILRNIKFGTMLNYVGKRNGGWNNVNGGVYTYDRLIPLAAYATADLSAGYSYRKFSLLAKLSNITNELNYVVHENYSVNPIAPRQLVTTLTYKF